ncbi:MAG: type III pantothenate kinase [Flavobacteriales bacterium]|nr:type III pantothenate kinase [Flavobacteriales bacterium]
MSAGPIDLVLDVGNTRTKWALFQDGTILRQGAFATGDLNALQRAVSGSTISAVAMGSVSAPDAGFLSALRAVAPVLVLDGASSAPVRSAYATPDTLGADRLANVVAAARHFPARPVLVVDTGTCITYDLLEGDGTYAGGAISPGLRMRAKAMHMYSARLPEVDPGPRPAVLGTTTVGALAAGVHHGILGEIKEFIAVLGKERPEMAVVLTGGDGLHFTRALESGIFAIPFLTLEGYHALLEHHRSLHHGLVRGDADRAVGPG